MNNKQKAYAVFLNLVGAAMLICSLIRCVQGSEHASLTLMQGVTMCVFMWCCQMLPVPIEEDKGVDLSFLPVVAGVMSLGVSATMVLYALSGILLVRRDEEKRIRWRLMDAPMKELINLNNVIISAWIPGQLYLWIRGQLLMDAPALSGGAVSAAVLFSVLSILCNLALFLVFYQLGGYGQIWALLRESIMGMLPSVLCTIPIGILLGVLLQQPYGFLLLVLFMAPVLLARYAFQLYLKSKTLNTQIMSALSAAIDAKDPYTRGHSQRVAEYSRKIAEEMKLPRYEVEQIYMAALLHDVGKIGIDDAVLRKPAALTEEEYREIRRHPDIGCGIVEKISLPKEVIEGIQYHHTRYDGTGYPPLPEEYTELPLCAAILAVADCYDAMRSDRPYRAGMEQSEVCAELRKSAGAQLSPTVVQAFLRSMGEEA